VLAAGTVLTVTTGANPSEPSDYSHLRRQRSNRGFSSLPPVYAGYGGLARVYTSSAASDAYLWLKVIDPHDAEAVVHLRADVALALAEQLLFLLRNHYHGDQLWKLRHDPYDAYADCHVPGVGSSVEDDDADDADDADEETT
jgi:hypothetical protein